MKRVIIPELLDTDSGSPEEVQASLADLHWLNRYFGGLPTTTWLLNRVAERTGVTGMSYLDVGGAAGDASVAVHRALAKRGIKIDMILLDRLPSHLLRNGSVSIPKLAAVSADALHLPFADGSFDVVGSSLFLHHLEPAEVLQFMGEALRVCRHAVIINDLHRSLLHWIAAIAGTLVYRSRLTRSDAVASVRRAYTSEEMRSMMKQTYAAGIELSEHYFYRIGVVAWKHA